MLRRIRSLFIVAACAVGVFGLQPQAASANGENSRSGSAQCNPNPNSPIANPQPINTCR